MVDIVLHNNHDAIFMMAMIFIHDFLHDFGNLSGRITSIRAEIGEFMSYISDRAMMTEAPSTKKRRLGGNPYAFFDDDEPYTVSSGHTNALEHWMRFLKSSDITTIFSENESTQVRVLIEQYDSLLAGPTTRSRARAIQIIQDFIYETKLYVFGLVYSEDSQTGGRVENPSNKANVIAYQEIPKIASKGEFLLKPEEKVLLKPEIKVSSKREENLFSIHCEHMRTAFDKAIYKFSHDLELVNYFKFMKTLYLYYEDENKNPYTIFNNTHIESALTLYLLDTKHEAIHYNNTHLLLKSLKMHYEQKFNKYKMKGGNPQDIQSYIEREFENLFFVILGAGKVDDIYSEYNEEAANDLLNTKIQNLISTLGADRETLEILNEKQYNMLIGIINSKYEGYKTMVARGDRKIVASKKEYVSACMNFLKYIYNTVNQHIASLTAQLNAEISKSASKSLSAEQKEGPQMILVTVAKGGKDYILANLDRTSNSFKRNTILNKECEIIDLVSSNKKFTSDTIDDGIKNAFIKYATDYQSNKILKSNKAMEELIKEKKRRNLKVIAINNAATDALRAVGMDKALHICPTSSVCDAQGTFGSCRPDKKISNREFYPMDFKIMNSDASICYHGRTELTEKNGGRITENRITFSAEVNNFFLPEVQIDIDITEKNSINILGANENYKELLNTIVSIWDRLFKRKQSYELTPKMLWDSLLKDTVFIEFVSAGAVKSVGDLFQEVNSIAQLGGYDSSRIRPKSKLDTLTTKMSGEFRVGANGDRPSGVRAGYLLLKSISGINNQAMAGYFSTGVGPFAIRSDIHTVFSEGVAQVAAERLDIFRPPEVNLNLLTVVQLKDMLKNKKLSVVGKKDELIKRLSESNGGTRKNTNNYRNNRKTRKYY